MRILVLTLVMSFLSHSAFGADSLKTEKSPSKKPLCSSSEGPVEQEITMKFFLDCLKECTLTGDSNCSKCERLLNCNKLILPPSSEER